MLDVIEELKNGNALTFVDEGNKDKLLTIANYYVDAFYDSFTYVTRGYDYAMDLMQIFVDAYNLKAFAMENASADYAENFVVTEAELDTVLAVAEKALQGSFEMDATETKDFEELKAEFEAAKKAWNAR